VKTIKLVMRGIWVGFAFNELTSYSSISGAKDACAYFHPEDEQEILDPEPYLINKIESILLLYDYIYRNGLMGDEPVVSSFRDRLKIPKEFPLILTDREYDLIFNALKKVYPIHWFFNSVEFTEEFIEEYIRRRDGTISNR